MTVSFMNPTAAVLTGIRFAQDQTRQSSDIDGVSALHVPHHTEELVAADRCWGREPIILFEDVATVEFLILHTCVHMGGTIRT